jgi:hypothetical protein
VTVITSDQRLSDLAAELRDRVRSLVDAVEIAASLESAGINDAVARDRYRARDTFDLADQVTSRVREMGPLVASRGDAESTAGVPERWDALVDYLRGPLAIIPIVLLLLIVAAYGEAGKWSTATTLAFSVGMTGSMLVTNCFVQALSRRGAIYVSREDFRSAGVFVTAVVCLALACVLAVATVGVIAVVALGVLSPGDALIFGAAFIALSVVWLLAGALALVRAPATLAVALGAGMAVAFVVDRALVSFSGEHVVVASIAGYATTIGAMIVAARRFYGRSDGADAAAALPSLAYLLDEAVPYFRYGALYMALVLLPHVLAWWAVMRGEPDGLSAATSFEVALTVSLIPIVVTGGLAERSARKFWLTARSALRDASVVRPQAFAEALLRYYATQMMRYLVALIVVSGIAYVAFSSTVGAEAIGKLVPAANAALVQVLFAGSLVAYAFLGWGLFNCIFIVGLGRPQDATRALKAGLIGTVVAGAPLAFGFHFGYSVIAFGLGALVFALSSFSAAHELLGSADYRYYASS